MAARRGRRRLVSIAVSTSGVQRSGIGWEFGRTPPGWNRCPAGSVPAGRGLVAAWWWRTYYAANLMSLTEILAVVRAMLQWVFGQPDATSLHRASHAHFAT